MRRGMRRSGYHPVSQILVDHHGAKITDITHRIPGVVQGNAFMFAKLKKGFCELFTQFGSSWVNKIYTFESQTKTCATGKDFVFFTKDGYIDHVPETQDFGGLQNTVIRPFR